MADKQTKVTITKEEYDNLQKRSLKLSALEGCGVDNWQGYDDAMDTYRESLTEEGRDD